MRSINSFAMLLLLFLDLPWMKRIYTDEKAFSHRSAARNKERFSPR